MAVKTIMYTNDSLYRHQPDAVLEVGYLITGAKAGSLIIPSPQITIGYDAPGSATAALGQTTIDTLLGSTNEFVAGTAFGSTAMGTDAIAFVLMCDGQVEYTNQMFLEVILNIAGTTTYDCVQVTKTALPDTLAAPARCQISSAGNIAVQFVKSGLDAATAGHILFRLGARIR